ncbi:MAG TPA: permease prefix domain 2-containing transporter [Candidatus Acidoferrum sp.]|nr:permease prefix domain 2-containing transporter [Candidatus Acidoferrum sp.]
MRHAARSPRPPRLAAWFVDLFAPVERAESILGDLHEEFSDLAGKSGVVPARRWYWGQSVRTIVHLFGGAFRNAPGSLGAIVLVGFLMHWFSGPFPEWVAGAILHAQRPFSNLHYAFYVWLINYGALVGCVVTSLFIGCVAAVLAKGREVVATLTLIVVRSVPFVWLLVVFEHNARAPIYTSALHLFEFRWVLEMTSILVAGVVVRRLRSVSLRLHAIT